MWSFCERNEKWFAGTSWHLLCWLREAFSKRVNWWVELLTCFCYGRGLWVFKVADKVFWTRRNIFLSLTSCSPCVWTGFMGTPGVLNTPPPRLPALTPRLPSMMHGELNVAHVSEAGHHDTKAMWNNPLFLWHPAQHGITCPWAVLSFTHSNALVCPVPLHFSSASTRKRLCVTNGGGGAARFKPVKMSACECAQKGGKWGAFPWLSHEAK